MRFVIFIDNGGVRKWVSSPTSTLTENPNFAAVLEDEVDDVYRYWDVTTDGKADMMTWDEFVTAVINK